MTAIHGSYNSHSSYGVTSARDAHDAEPVSVLAPVDVANELVNGEDIGSAIAALVFLSAKERRVNDRVSRDAAYAAEEAANESELQAMDRARRSRMEGGYLKSALQLGGAACSFATAAEPAGRSSWEGLGKTCDASTTLSEAVFGAETSLAERDAKEASQAAGQLKRVAESHEEDVRDAGKSMDKALEFLKEWRAARDAAVSAALHRA